MTEFTFACPVCGQHIKCESWRSNTVMECPTCFQKITVPQAPAAGNAKLIIAGTKVGERPIPTTGAGSGPATAPEKPFPMIAFVFVVLLCAAVAAAFAFGGKIFKSSGNQASGQTNQVTSASNEQKMPQPVPAKPTGGQTNEPTSQVTSASNEQKMPQPVPAKPAGRLASVIFAKGDSLALESGTAAAEMKDPARAAFLAAFKADLAQPSAFEGPGKLSIFPQYGRVVPGSSGDIQWHRSFPSGLVIVVTLQGLVPGHKYILSINGDPKRAGNSNLVDIYRASRYYDFSTVTTDMTGSYHATFGVMLPTGKYDVSFYVKETTDFSIVLYHDFFQFTVE